MDLTGLYADLPASQAVSASVDVPDKVRPLSNTRKGRRSASPCRVTLADKLGSGLDGAWWPRSTAIAGELPNLIDVLEEPLGSIVDIGVNWSQFEGVPNLDLLNRRGMATPGQESRRLRIMLITGAHAKASLLLVPFRTSTALAVMLLRRAAGLPVQYAHRATAAFDVAEAIVRAARDQDAVSSG